MPKDPTRNVDRYKIRGGQLNAFEFHQNQAALSRQKTDSWPHGDLTDEDALSLEQAKAGHIRQLLAEHGESVPQMNEPRSTPQVAGTKNEEASPESDANTQDEEFAPTHGRSPEVIKEMIQSRRATDVVPDPEDIAAGHPENSPEDKEHGRTRQAAAKQSRKQAEPVTKGKFTKAATGKQRPPSPPHNNIAKVAAPKDNQQTTAQKSAKSASTPKSSKSALRKNTGKAATPSSTSQTSSHAHKAASRKAITRTAIQTGRKTATKKAANGDSRKVR